MIKNLLFVNKCAHCGAHTQDALCKNCKTPIRLLNFGLCQRCGKPIENCICKALGKAPIRIASAYKLEEPAVSSLIYKLKSKGNKRVVRFLSGAMAEKFEREFAGIAFDFVTFVPTTPKKLRQKGFDHARLLAEKIANELKLPLISPPIKRRQKPAQKFLSRLARLLNADSAFKLCGKATLRGTALLIDDVVTTGATLSACAELLLRAGADKVYCLTAATAAKKS